MKRPIHVFFTIIIVSFYISNSYCQFKIEKTTVGVLMDDDEHIIGTSFVAGKSKSIFTCSHVAVLDTLWYLYGGSNLRYKVTVKYNLPCYDIAFLQRTGGEQPYSLEFGYFNLLQPRDTIVYVGYDSRLKSLLRWESVILSKGITISDLGDCNKEYIDFEGKAIPGYSGGPVFNKSGEIIGIIGQAWIQKNPRGGSETNMNRAFSIDLLKVLDSELLEGSIQIATGGNNTLMDVIYK